MNFERLKEFIIGKPLPTTEFGTHNLNNTQALAALSPDALSSIAYANQEIFLGLVTAGAVGLSMSFTIGLAITLILTMLTLSYYQTIHAYPSGGGSWIVASKNLGVRAGLFAAAALLLDYMLVSAVSLTAGVEAIASAFPFLVPHRVELSLFILLILLVINLRGTSEAGTVISVPVYLFLFTFIPMLGYGIIRAIIEGPGDLTIVAPQAIQPLSLVLLIHTFSSGCAALTGVEAISNAVPAFKEPKTRNASNTLLVMSVILGILFLSSIGLAQYFAVIPRPGETILSALARRILGDGPLYVLIQVSTLLILSVAANTAFTDFPRVAALLAQESYVPRQLSNLGDRLVFANGVYLLSAITTLLIVIFRANSHALIPLFTVGAFLAFTLSQFGMVLHWWRIRGDRWQLKSLLNGIGGLTTLAALLIVSSSKFYDGAWITIILILLGVYAFLRIRDHYREFDAQMSPWDIILYLKERRSIGRAIIPVSHITRGTVDAIHLATKIAQDVMGVHILFSDENREKIESEWSRMFPNVPLYVIPSPYRSVTKPLMKFLEDMDNKLGGEPTAVVLPSFVTNKWWQTALHNQTTWWIRAKILENNRRLRIARAIIEVPCILKNNAIDLEQM